MSDDIEIRMVDYSTMPADRKCQECGKRDELRPYGRGGKWICFDCGMKEPETTSAEFGRVAFGDGKP